MKTVLFVLGGKVDNGKPTAHFLLRAKAAIEYFNAHKSEEEISFLVSGRWASVTEAFELSEAEVGRQYILNEIEQADVIIEDISVELIGNYAFSKPLIMSMQPDKVMIFSSAFMKTRNETIAKRVFADELKYEVVVITNELSDNEVLVEKERKAIGLFSDVFQDVHDGDDAGFRNILLYGTPYYFKGLIKDEDFFDRYWEGGFENLIHGRAVRRSLN